MDAGFIYEIEHTEWISPIVIVTKKNGKIRVCVDLKKVNATTVRDHYHLPFIEHVLKRVVGHEAYSFLNGFSVKIIGEKEGVSLADFSHTQRGNTHKGGG